MGAPAIERSFEMNKDVIRRNEKITGKDIQQIEWVKSTNALTQLINGKMAKQLNVSSTQQNAVFIDSTIFLYLLKTSLPTNQDTWILGKGEPYIANIERIDTGPKIKINYVAPTKNGIVFMDTQNEPSTFEFHDAGETAKGERTKLICK